MSDADTIEDAENETLTFNAKVKGILFYTHSRAMKEAERIIGIYAHDPLIYLQDKNTNNLCHVIMRLWWAVKNNYTKPELLSDKQKWSIYYEMKKRVRDARALQTEDQ